MGTRQQESKLNKDWRFWLTRTLTRCCGLTACVRPETELQFAGHTTSSKVGLFLPSFLKLHLHCKSGTDPVVLTTSLLPFALSRLNIEPFHRRSLPRFGLDTTSRKPHEALPNDAAAPLHVVHVFPALSQQKSLMIASSWKLEARVFVLVTYWPSERRGRSFSAR
jgi:hypothetical protein